MNKILKKALIIGGIYGGCNLIFDLGKAHMIGTLAKYDVTANEVMDIISQDKRARLKFIFKSANIFKQEKGR